MVNTPIPHSLQSEAKKAAKILKDFTIPNAKVGPDKVIPAGLVESAAGLAILTVVKLGFLVTARGGSGIVIAQLRGGKWSAPSAIGIAGLGGGFEVGAEVTDFVIILHSKKALDAFSKGGNLTLGGNFTIAAGPMGRNLEGDVALRSPAAIYTYSKTKGLFAGISIEGSALIERKDANKKFYGRDDIRAWHMLGGAVDPPPECQQLYEVLQHHREMYEKALMAQAKKYARKGASRAVDEGAKRYGVTGYVSKMKSVKQTKRTTSITTSPDGKTVQQTYVEETSGHCDPWEDPQPGVHGWRQTSGHSDPWEDPQPDKYRSQGAGFKKRPVSSHEPNASCRGSQVYSDAAPSAPHSRTDVGIGHSLCAFRDQWDRDHVTVRAVYKFDGEMPCDLSFIPGDIIEVLTRTDTQEDWWEGRLKNRVGIFPANYVTLV